MSVGASIISIITESLYDKPLVVFREYVQNSLDAFSMIGNSGKDDIVDITVQRRANQNNNDVTTGAPIDIFFLDNGSGVAKDDFKTKMISIAKSPKQKTVHIGYKGIGRLSGISYCQRLTFVNILSYNDENYQIYSIDCKQFRDKKNTQKFLDSDVKTAMNQIGSMYDNLKEVNDFIDVAVHTLLRDRKDCFKTRDTGFLVVMEDISQILTETVDMAGGFINELCWLLPVSFKDELYTHNKYGSLLEGLSEEMVEDSIPAKGYPIWLHIDGQKLELRRPITSDMLRDYVFIRKFKDAQDGTYAIALFSFNNNRIAIDRKNPFSGFKVYIDNMLLCDENELLTMLKNLNLTSSTQNELIQTVQAVGVMLYIVDKVNLSANARRTFIDIADTDAINFLQMVSDFITEIYEARYALSAYSKSAEKNKEDANRLKELLNKADVSLQKLANNQMKVELVLSQVGQKDFNELTQNEKKKIIKKIITDETGQDIKEYMDLGPVLNRDCAYKDFVDWFVKKYLKN